MYDLYVVCKVGLRCEVVDFLFEYVIEDMDFVGIVLMVVCMLDDDINLIVFVYYWCVLGWVNVF